MPTLINVSEVDDGLDAKLVATCAMGGPEGYLGTQLYRSAAPNARSGFVNVA
jgi:hypothetical protein